MPSGLTATTLPLLALVPGDHVLVTDAVYGPTRRFCEPHLRRLGVEVDVLRSPDRRRIARDAAEHALVFLSRRARSRSRCRTFRAIAEAAHPRGALVVLDNSWATPLEFRAFDHGVDVSVHAATKYIGGHSDVLLGVIVASEATYRRCIRLWTDMGVTASPDDCFLGCAAAHAGHAARAPQASALRIAQWLQARPEVRKCCTRRLPGRARARLWKRDFPARRRCSASC